MLWMNRHDVREWAANHRAAAEREQAEMRRHRLTPDEAFASALALLNFDERLNGSPFNRNHAIDEREDQQVWDAWAKLRERWRSGS
jgi:hypothetical protein